MRGVQMSASHSFHRPKFRHFSIANGILHGKFTLPVEMSQREMVDCPNFEEAGDDPKSARSGNGQRPLVRAERDGEEHG